MELDSGYLIHEFHSACSLGNNDALSYLSRLRRYFPHIPGHTYLIKGFGNACCSGSISLVYQLMIIYDPKFIDCSDITIIDIINRYLRSGQLPNQRFSTTTLPRVERKFTRSNLGRLNISRAVHRGQI
jgi:hypothetical protein